MARAAADRPRPHDPIDHFFAGLAARGTEPLLHAANGSVRFDLADGERTARYLVEVDRGTVRVSRRADRPDAVVRASRALFGALVAGRANAMASLLRGLLVIEGDLGLATTVARVFPGPPEAEAAYAERRRRAGTAAGTRAGAAAGARPGPGGRR